MKYVAPGQPGSIVQVAPRYENFTGGKWLAPTQGKYRIDLSPATATAITEVLAGTVPARVVFEF
jgi:aldehyde dehydrogenase